MFSLLKNQNLKTRIFEVKLLFIVNNPQGNSVCSLSQKKKINTSSLIRLSLVGSVLAYLLHLTQTSLGAMVFQPNFVNGIVFWLEVAIV